MFNRADKADMEQTSTPVKGLPVRTPMKDLPLASLRCERCGAQAYVNAITEFGDFAMCRHHFNEHCKPDSKLVGLIIELQDYRHHLEVERTPVVESAAG